MRMLWRTNATCSAVVPLRWHLTKTCVVALQARELKAQVSKVPTQQFISVAPAQQQAMR
jgi:hypothetical protein